jgi:hypothetical protein
MKYKHAEAEGWYYYINDAGEKGQSWSAKNRPKMYEAMMNWAAAGNEIDPRYTDEELAIKEAAAAKQALENQVAQCQRLLDETDKTMASDWPYKDDKTAWEVYRNDIRAIMKSGKIQKIPAKPFG